MDPRAVSPGGVARCFLTNKADEGVEQNVDVKFIWDNMVRERCGLPRLPARCTFAARPLLLSWRLCSAIASPNRNAIDATGTPGADQTGPLRATSLSIRARVAIAIVGRDKSQNNL